MVATTMPSVRAKPRPAANKEVSLTVSIGRVPYAVRPLQVDAAAAVRGYELAKGDGTTYHVAQLSYGCECTCPDYVYRREGLDPRGCKHVRALSQFGMIATGAVR